MNAFARASAVLHRNRDGSVELVYTPMRGAMVLGLRGLMERPVEAVGFAPRGGGATAKGERLSISYGDLSCAPERGDEVQITDRLMLDRDTLTVDHVERDDDNYRWLLTLTRATLPRT